MIRYEHTQSGTVIRWAAFGGAAFVTAMAVPNGTPGLLVVALILLLVGALFHSLTVRVGPDSLTVLYGIGLIRFSFPRREIRECRQVRNRWWYGWGIRWTPHGWLYNISGFDAVEMVMADGRKYRIGTDEPARLLQALQ